jgi:predicted DNA-binding ribbon-helix-helix protein
MGAAGGHAGTEVSVKRPTPSASPTALRKHSVNIAGHRTSVTLEHAFWSALHGIADERGVSVASLIAEIDRQRETDSAAPNLSSAIRVFVLQTRRRG